MWRKNILMTSPLVLSTMLLALSTADLSAQNPTGHIPSINAKVTSLRFFETPPPPNVVPRARRVYSNRFSRSQVRRIFWELDLEHPAPGRRVNFVIDSMWYSPTSTGQGTRLSMQASLQRDWTWSYWHYGGEVIGKWKVIEPGGRVYSKEEPWPVGPYRVDIYIGGAKVTSGTFEITDGTPSRAGRSVSTTGDRDKNAAEAAYQQADRLTDQLKFREAIPELDKAIRLDPELVSAYALRGYSYNAIGSLENKPEYTRRAVEDYTTAIQKSLKNGVRRPGLYNSRGAVYRALNDNQRALQDYNEAIKIDPTHVTALSNRGELRRGMGDLDGSIADLTRVIQLEPGKGARYCQRGLTWLRKAKEADAQNDFRRCSELDPKTRQDYTRHINKIHEEQKKKP
jgi:tetratricopeptide (TPR) repeat protein